MNRIEALAIVRDLIGEKLPAGQTQGNWSNAQLYRYIAMGEMYAYALEINNDPTRFISDAVLAQTDRVSASSELYNLPSGFKRILTLKDYSDSTNDSYSDYREIPLSLRNRWLESTPYGKAFYFQDIYIGILPLPTSTASFSLMYHRAHISMTDVAHSDLHEISQQIALLHASLIALTDAGDANVSYIQKEIDRWEGMLRNIRRSGTNAYVAHQYMYPHSNLPFNITTT